MSRRFNYVHEELRSERYRQDGKWGGPDHDDEHPSEEWFELIETQVSRAKSDNDYRGHLVKIGALAIAALEAHDRAGDVLSPDELKSAHRLRVLKKLEWGMGGQSCIVCFHRPDEGHRADCELNHVLKKGK